MTYHVCLAIDGSFVGGGQRHVLDLARDLKKNGLSVTVFTSEKGAFSIFLEKNAIPYRIIPMGKFPAPWRLPAWKTALRELNPDLLHLHGGMAGFWGLWASGGNPPYKIVYTIHGVHYIHQPFFLYRWVRWFLDLLLKNRADRVICVSEHDAGWVRKLKIADPEKIRVIHNGINILPMPDTPSSISSVVLPPDAFVVVVIGRLSFEKGQRYAIEAMSQLVKKHPSIHLLIVGDGEEKPSLEKRVERLNLKNNVHFLGFRRDVPSILGFADLNFMPSLWEGLPLSLLEAMAGGLPSVATRVGGVPEIVQDGVEAILVPPKNPGQMAKAIERLYLDSEFRSQMGLSARRKAQSFEQSKSYARTREIYKDLLNQ